MESIFFVAACVVLCFRFVTKRALRTHWDCICCWKALTQCQDLFCFSLCHHPAGGTGVEKELAGDTTGTADLNWPKRYFKDIFRLSSETGGKGSWLWPAVYGTISNALWLVCCQQRFGHKREMQHYKENKLHTKQPQCILWSLLVFAESKVLGCYPWVMSTWKFTGVRNAGAAGGNHTSFLGGLLSFCFVAENHLFWVYLQKWIKGWKGMGNLDQWNSIWYFFFHSVSQSDQTSASPAD